MPQRLSVVLLASAVGVALVPLPGALVERVYSRMVFPVLQVWVTRGSNLTTLALFDVLVAVVVVGLAASIGVDVARRRTWLATAARTARRLVSAAALLYLAFALMWGLNYRRLPLEDKLAFDSDAVTNSAARALGFEAVRQVDALYEDAHRGGWPQLESIDPVLAGRFAEVIRVLGGTAPVEVARPKATWLEPYFRYAAVDGMINPYLLETLVNTRVLPFERPMIVAHEWSHLAGFADEGEASFVGWLACVRGSASHRYSAWLALYSETTRVLPAHDRLEIAASLASGPRADLRAIADRVRQHASPRVTRISQRAYDRYLKANGIAAGTASYEGVVRLVLGTGVASGVAGFTPAIRASLP